MLKWDIISSSTEKNLLNPIRLTEAYLYSHLSSNIEQLTQVVRDHLAVKIHFSALLAHAINTIAEAMNETVLTIHLPSPSMNLARSQPPPNSPGLPDVAISDQHHSAITATPLHLCCIPAFIRNIITTSDRAARLAAIESAFHDSAIWIDENGLIARGHEQMMDRCEALILRGTYGVKGEVGVCLNLVTQAWELTGGDANGGTDGQGSSQENVSQDTSPGSHGSRIITGRDVFVMEGSKVKAWWTCIEKQLNHVEE